MRPSLFASLARRSAARIPASSPRLPNIQTAIIVVALSPEMSRVAAKRLHESHHREGEILCFADN